MCWNAPQVSGEFNFTIKVTEWRKTSFGGYIKAGWVIRDIQLFVLSGVCDGNEAPEIQPLLDTCILAGTSLNIPVIYSDDDLVTLNSYGQPFTASPPA